VRAAGKGPTPRVHSARIALQMFAMVVG